MIRVHNVIANIQLASADMVFDLNHLVAPSVKNHAGNMEARICVYNLAGD
jgi:hypothetical protein